MFDIKKIFKSAALISFGNVDSPKFSPRLGITSRGIDIERLNLRFNPDTGQWSYPSQNNEKIPVRFFDSTENELFAHDYYKNLNDIYEDNLSHITYDALCVALRERVMKFNNRYYTVEFKEDNIKIMNDSNHYRIRKDSTNIYVDKGELVIFNGVLEPRYFEIHSTINEGIKL